MDYKEKATILQVCSSKKGERCSHCPAFGQGCRNCMKNAMKDGAAAITELLANDNQVKESLQLNGFETLGALLEAYNQVRTENTALRRMQPVRLDDTGAQALALAAEVSEMRQKLEAAEDDNKKLCAAMMQLKRIDRPERMSMVYELEYDSSMSHKTMEEVAEILFRRLMDADLDLRGRKEKTMKPFLFNTEMVRAILDGRKTVTRRVVRRKELDDVLSSPCRIKNPDIPDGRFINCLCTAPCEAGDILWVRETWAAWSPTYGVAPKLYYKADGDAPAGIKWRPSIYMPKEAARLFLRVKEVSVERLREISALSAMDEGVTDWNDFVRLWNTTIKPANLPLYGWEANPWVWVIEFERISKEEALGGGGDAN